MIAYASIDEGAYKAISRKESGGRLLPAGVVRVDGMFASHQAVRLVVRRRRRAAEGSPTAQRPTSAPNAETTKSETPVTPVRAIHEPISAPVTSHVNAMRHLQGQGQIQTQTQTTAPGNPAAPSSSTAPASPSPSHLAAAKHQDQPFASSANSTEATSQPSTPTLDPIASMSSSIASLDPLSSSRSIPPSPAMKAITERLAASSMNSALGQELRVIAEAQERERDLEAGSRGREDLSEGERGGQGEAEGRASRKRGQSRSRSAGGDRDGAKNETDHDHRRVLDVNDEWEEVEIGKGLAQYNSVEIDRIKGRKR
jgi:glutamate 5-kinase